MRPNYLITIRKPACHRGRFRADSGEPDMEITMQPHTSQAAKPLLVPRPDTYNALKDPDPETYPHAQDETGLCVAVFRPNALTPVTQGMHLRYVWSGRKQRITDVLEVRLALT